ncbi:hypothetical protein VSR17_20845 [Cupriavidus taiwanensis]|uniref:hypothetical protein n=1 Tax=Cupriavidus taiwanensis TaxID=164546 RepID=UPI000E12ADB2|nr:hypothetical protein [Cupriavidus taiwanensis]SPA26895.1 conserved hypothetical protein [Cupriavidus taiwanensis]
MTLFSFFDKANLTKRDERVLRDIMTSPEAEQILARAERTTIEKRKELRLRLDGVDARHDKGISAAGEVYWKAHLAREAAEAKLIEAREDERRASATCYALESAKGQETRDLELQLLETRDPRLDDFYLHLRDAKQQLRHLVRITAFPNRTWTGERSVTYETNADEVHALSTVLKEAMVEVQRMTLLPVTRNEVSERLTTWAHKLEPMLDAFSLSTPRLDENGEVKLSREPLKFVEVLQANRVFDREDMPAPKPVRASSPRPPAVKRAAAIQKPIVGALKPATTTKKGASAAPSNEIMRCIEAGLPYRVDVDEKGNFAYTLL